MYEVNIRKSTKDWLSFIEMISITDLNKKLKNGNYDIEFYDYELEII